MVHRVTKSWTPMGDSACVQAGGRRALSGESLLIPLDTPIFIKCLVYVSHLLSTRFTAFLVKKKKNALCSLNSPLFCSEDRPM